MKVLGLITARGGSKGIPGKNIKMLGSKPLLAYVAQDASVASHISRLVISTEDEQIASVAQKCGVEVPFLRPIELAQDHTPSLEVVVHALKTLENQGEVYDAVCLLQPTSPFKPKGFIDACISRFLELNADSLISVLEVPHQYNPHWVFETGQEGFLKISTGENSLIPRRQELPKAFYRDGSVYVFRKENVLVHNALVFGKTAFMLSNPDYYCNLDTMEDWGNAEKHKYLHH